MGEGGNWRGWHVSQGQVSAATTEGRKQCISMVCPDVEGKSRFRRDKRISMSAKGRSALQQQKAGNSDFPWCGLTSRRVQAG